MQRTDPPVNSMVCANDAGALQGAAFCVQTRETCWPDLAFIDIDGVVARA